MLSIFNAMLLCNVTESDILMSVDLSADSIKPIMHLTINGVFRHLNSSNYNRHSNDAFILQSHFHCPISDASSMFDDLSLKIDDLSFKI